MREGFATSDIAFLPGRREDLRELDAALAELLGVGVSTRELQRGVPAITHAQRFAQTPEEPEVGVLVTAQESAVDCLLLLVRPHDARRLGQLLGDADAPSERLLDDCREIGMIVAGRYLAVLERFMAPSGVPSPPVATIDMQAAIVESIVAQTGASATASLFEITVATAPPVTMHLLVFA